MYPGNHMPFAADDVARYLEDNPGFFEQYAEMLATIYVPHPHGGRAIPIAERQMVTLREKNKALERKLHELVEFGQQNDAIIERLHRMALSLLAASDLDAALAATYANLRDDFAVPQTGMRLWARGEWHQSEFHVAGEEVHVFAESLSNPYCSAQAMFETATWFGASATGLNSFAYVPLRGRNSLGLLALASPDAQRFYPEMGTVYLKRLGELVGHTLARFLD